MFTGIVRAVGKIVNTAPIKEGDQQAGLRLTVDAAELDLSQVQVGDSIAIQGACMTVLSYADGQFEVDISQESLSRTAGLDKLGPVNLEAAMKLGDTLDGHMVLGHVDGVGHIAAFEPVGESYLLQIAAPEHCAKYLAFKGSVTINGVSLTINDVQDDAQGGCTISINLIPHTVAATTFQYANVGDAVNIEVDTIARYVERMLQKIKA
ncbi:MAG TPA: riboflavin synthase [Paenalcaligenes sp.]|nr:riboflavin synthase [Paenalcaligenes sp.]